MGAKFRLLIGWLGLSSLLGFLVKETFADAVIHSIESKIADLIGVSEARVVAFITTYGLVALAGWLITLWIYRLGQQSRTSRAPAFDAEKRSGFSWWSTTRAKDTGVSSPCLSLRDLFGYLAPHLPLRATKKTESGAFIDGVDPRWRPIGDLVLKPLSLGRLHAVGRQRQKAKRLQSAPILPEFWREAKFTYWFLDSGPSNVSCATNGSDSYSEIEVDRNEAVSIWPNGAEFPLLDVAREIYEEVKDSAIGIVIDGLNDSADDKLTWICNEIAMYRGGKEPLVKLRGNQPPSRRHEDIYTAPLISYDFIVEGNAIVLQERYGKSRWENLMVTALDMDKATRDLQARQC